MDINHNQVIYIPKGEHNDPHELPQQQELEGSTEIEHTLYSHTDTISSETNSFQKLDYIYQHFQDNEKIHESDPNLARYQNDNTLYPHINNDIEYGLFEDVISSYYLDSQIKDDFKCDQNYYTNTQQKQQDQPLTPCTHAYDHITQHINNLEDPYHDFNNGDALTFKDNIQHYYNRNYKTRIGVYMTLSQPKVTKYLWKWIQRQCHMQCIFLVIRRPLQKLIRSHTR